MRLVYTLLLVGSFALVSPQQLLGTATPIFTTHPPAITLSDCGLVTERRLTVIKSNGFPTPYASDIDCQYRIKRQSPLTCTVTFLFNVLDLESSENCTKDYVAIQGEKVCGSRSTGYTKTLTFEEGSDTQEVVMEFHSDSNNSGLGFMVTVVQQECATGNCSREFNEMNFEMRSPNYPAPYDNDGFCEYTVHKAGPNICSLKVVVMTFDLEDGQHCEADVLDFGVEKFCGVLEEGQIFEMDFVGEVMTIRFRSDHSTRRDGFNLQVSQVECTHSKNSTDTITVSPTLSSLISTTFSTTKDIPKTTFSTTKDIPKTTFSTTRDIPKTTLSSKQISSEPISISSESSNNLAPTATSEISPSTSKIPFLKLFPPPTLTPLQNTNPATKAHSIEDTYPSKETNSDLKIASFTTVLSTFPTTISATTNSKSSSELVTNVFTTDGETNTKEDSIVDQAPTSSIPSTAEEISSSPTSSSLKVKEDSTSTIQSN